MNVKDEVADVHCCHFNHKHDPDCKDGTPPLSAGDVHIQKAGEEHIYIMNACVDCLKWFNDPFSPWIYLLCENCAAGQWVDKRLSRHRYPVNSKIIWLRNTNLRSGCPSCLDDEWKKGLEAYRNRREESKKKNG
jgi:hypothetical protein